MEFYEKRPTFNAAQFDGTTASIEQMYECGMIGEYVISVNPIGSKATLNIGAEGDQQVITLKQREWLVRGPDGNLSVMSSDQIRERFEKVPA